MEKRGDITPTILPVLGRFYALFVCLFLKCLDTLESFFLSLFKEIILKQRGSVSNVLKVAQGAGEGYYQISIIYI